MIASVFARRKGRMMKIAKRSNPCKTEIRRKAPSIHPNQDVL